jgi:DDE superfamily endonuclease/Helix-turn-helix of DDE superfamily endonuclease
MILRYAHLSTHPTVFTSMTGLRVGEFDALVRDLLPRYHAAEQARLSRPARRRAIGAGHPFELTARDQILLTVVWLRVYPIYEVLGYLFDVSDTTAGRTVTRLLPLLEAAGLDSMRMPDPGRKRRRHLDQLLADTPELVVLIDTFEQRVQRPRERRAADKLYSGKKKQHTLKSQLAVDEVNGKIVDVPERVPGPTADITLVAESGVLGRLPEHVGAAGDLAYVGMQKLHPQGQAVTPRRKPRGQERPPEDIEYNRAFARRRIPVEHTIGRVRRYQSLAQTDRHHRKYHTARVRAVAGLVNRQVERRRPRCERRAA